jgi:ABC-type phosphate/phosphonate transport system substrate-binding protein
MTAPLNSETFQQGPLASGSLLGRVSASHGRRPFRLPGCLLAFLLLATVASAQPPAAPPGAIRIGFLARQMGNTNRNDLVAGMRAWLLTVARERNQPVEPIPKVFDSYKELETALRQKELDVFQLSMEDFLLIEKAVPCTGVFASKVNGKVSEQYVLVVRKDRGWTGLRDLRGGELLRMDHMRTSLASIWLDWELMRLKQPAGDRFFGKVTPVTKPNLAILPVFFRQASAAIVTRPAFTTACELNPQLAKELQVLVASPDLIPGVGAYSKSASPAAVKFYRTEALKLTETVAGRHVLNLFQADSIVEVSEADLAPTRSFLAEHARLKAGTGGRKAAP